eukprot:7013146-Prymnesium_polylepis.1
MGRTCGGVRHGGASWCAVPVGLHPRWQGSRTRFVQRDARCVAFTASGVSMSYARRVGSERGVRAHGGGAAGGCTRVGEDRHFREALGVERVTDRADAPVHHVRGRDD